MTLKRLILGIGILTLCLTTTYPQSSHDGSRIAMLYNHLVKNVWYTDGAPYFNTVDMVFDRGHFYSDKPPIYVLFTSIVLKPLSWFIDFNSQQGVRILYYLAAVTSSGLSLLALAFLMWKLLKFMGCRNKDIGLIILGCFFGNAFFPYNLMYITHMSEALLLVGAFYFLLKNTRSDHKSKNALFTGILGGLNAVIHPFVSGLFAIFSAGYLISKKQLRPLVLFCLATSFVVGSGLMINYKIFGHIKPYYMMPEKYIYAFVNEGKTYYSGFLLSPTVQGLTEKQMSDRMNQFPIPPAKKEQFLKRLRDYKSTSKSQMEVALSNWARWDYLFFNPLMIFVLCVLFKNIASKSSQYRSEKILVIVTIFGAYYSSIFQRSMPGNCMGNRYLVPLMPLLFIVAGNEIVSNEKYRCMFKRLTWMCMAVFLPGIIRPMNEPEGLYSKIVATLFALMSVFCCLYVFNSKLRKFSEEVLNIFAKKTILRYGFFILFSLMILKLYTFSYNAQIHSFLFFRTLQVYLLIPITLLFLLKDTPRHTEF